MGKLTLFDISWGSWCKRLPSSCVQNYPGSIRINSWVQGRYRRLYNSHSSSGLAVGGYRYGNLAGSNIKSTFGDHTAWVIGVCDHNTCRGHVLVGRASTKKIITGDLK